MRQSKLQSPLFQRLKHLFEIEMVILFDFDLILIFFFPFLNFAVCISVLDKVMQQVAPADKKSYAAIEATARAFCKKTIEKENRLVSPLSSSSSFFESSK